MKCLNCGSENIDRARFCAKCGAPLTIKREEPMMAEPMRPTEPAPMRPEETTMSDLRMTGSGSERMMPHDKPKKKKGLLIWIIILASVILVSLLTVGGIMIANATNPYNKQIKVGYEYLEAGQYEEAIIEFDKAIEIDARKPKAYVGKADTYATRCDENAVEDIEETFTEATEQNQKNTETIIEETLRIADLLKDNGHNQQSVDLLEAMYEILQDERLKQKADKNFEEYYKSVLMELYNGGEDAIKDFLFSSEMDYIVSKMSAVDCFWYAEYGDLSAPGSMGIGLYPDGLIYVGEWADGMFEGSGKYYAASDDGETYVTLEGAFVAGIPNGQATMINEFVNGYYNESVGYTYIREEYIGNYIDGICDGEFEIRAITDGGEVHAVVDPKVTYVDGIPQKIKDFNSEKYIAGEVPGTTLVWVSDGSVEYAPGYPRDESIQAAFEEETTEEEATDAE